jgi:tetratricopeptide (TPR) repeat protein
MSPALNGLMGTVQPRDTWIKGDPAMWTVDRVTVRLDTDPPRSVSLVPLNIVVVSAAPRGSSAGGAAARGSAAGGDDGACTICLDSEPKPIQKGCACRGDAGLAHLDCLIQAAAHMQTSSGSMDGWRECSTCHQIFNGEIARGLATELSRRSEENPDDLMDFLLAASSTSRTMLMASKFAEAEVLCRKQLATLKLMGCDDFGASMVRQSLAVALDSQGRRTEAQAIFERVVADFTQEYGPDRESTLETTLGLAVNLNDQGKFDEAVAIYRDTLRRSIRTCGATSGFTAMCGVSLAMTLDSQDNKSEALSLCSVYMPILVRTYGPDHPSVVVPRAQYGILLACFLRLAEAEVEMSEALASQTRMFGAHHPSTLKTAQMLAACRSQMAAKSKK